MSMVEAADRSADKQQVADFASAGGQTPSPRWRMVVAHACALAVAGVFLFAAYEKIIEPRQFALDIGNFQILPKPYWNLLAIFLPWWEVGAALALLLPRTRRAGVILMTGMLLMFIVAVSYAALYKGYNINCGCFGKNSAAAGWKTIGLDVALLIGTFLSLLGCPRRPCGAV